jgi:hypothetical protein
MRLYCHVDRNQPPLGARQGSWRVVILINRVAAQIHRRSRSAAWFGYT